MSVIQMIAINDVSCAVLSDWGGRFRYKTKAIQLQMTPKMGKDDSYRLYTAMRNEMDAMVQA